MKKIICSLFVAMALVGIGCAHHSHEGCGCGHHEEGKEHAEGGQCPMKKEAAAKEAKDTAAPAAAKSATH